MKRDTHNFLIGFPDEETRFHFVRNLQHHQCPLRPSHTLQFSIVWDPPRGSCWKCFNPDNPEDAKGHMAADCRALTCPICHSSEHVEAGCGYQRRRFRPTHYADIMNQLEDSEAADRRVSRSHSRQEASPMTRESRERGGRRSEGGRQRRRRLAAAAAGGPDHSPSTSRSRSPPNAAPAPAPPQPRSGDTTGFVRLYVRRPPAGGARK